MNTASYAAPRISTCEKSKLIRCIQHNGKEIIICKTEDLSNNILLEEDFWWEVEALYRLW